MLNSSDQNNSGTNDTRVYLRGVDLADLTERYLNNEFVTLSEPLPVDISILKEKPQNIVTVADTNTLPSYQLDLGTGQSFACIGYKVYDRSGRYAALDPYKEYNCMYCLRKIKEKPLGIPIRREERDGKIFYHMVDIFCSFNCILAEYRRRINNCIYSQSMTYLSEIYFKCTGRDISEVKPASDQRLLKIFNGPLSWDDYHTGTVTYTEKPGNMYFIPTVEYI